MRATTNWGSTQSQIVVGSFFFSINITIEDRYGNYMPRENIGSQIKNIQKETDTLFQLEENPRAPEISILIVTTGITKNRLQRICRWNYGSFSTYIVRC